MIQDEKKNSQRLVNKIFTKDLHKVLLASSSDPKHQYLKYALGDIF